MPDLRYRFRGQICPESIRAEKPSSEVVDGVAKLRLYDVIDSWGGYWGVSAKEFAQALDEIGTDPTEIHLHINSPGGEVWQGIAMLNSLRAHPARVVAVVDGLAASAASFIAAGADEVVMGRNSQMMIHDAWGIGIGPAETMRKLAARLDKTSDNIASIYADKAGGTSSDWRGLMLAETWYSAAEAVEAGLADRVEQQQTADDDEAKAAFDLSVFRYAGRSAAPAPRADQPAADTAAAGPYSPESLDRRIRGYQARYRRLAA